MSSTPQDTSSRGGLAERVRKQVQERIAAEGLAAGDRLPPERELARELGVSRNVLREALGALAAMEVVEIRRGAGVFVHAFIERTPDERELGHEGLRALLQARLVLEPGLAALAAARARAADLDHLEALLQRASAAAPDDPERFLALDIELHRYIATLAGNPFLLRCADELEGLATAGRRRVGDSPALRALSLRDHTAIVRALRAADGAAASEAMRRHLQHAALSLEAIGG